MSLTTPATTDGPRYARFSRRLKAILLDWMLAMALLFGAVALASNLQSDTVARVLGIAVVLILVFYEPVLVSRTGGTLGHYWTNLRIVDDGGGNLSFRKAFARFAIKSLLSWYSFLTMMATRRNQAVHDLLTHSTVQIRDLTKATSSQFITERRELDDAAMPSRLRRTLVTMAYLALGVFTYVMALGALLERGLLSSACLDRDVCSGGDRIVGLAVGTVLLLMLALVIGLGWRGLLPGARRA
ncbi:RDD family protein [Bradyrhizobium sp. UFLA05-109]